MRVRKAHPEDIPQALELAGTLDLDYPGMETDALWVAEEAGEIVGFVVLKTHLDCLELCALGVDPKHRDKGTGKSLVEALMAEAPGDVHLATVIPAFFESCGFASAVSIPPTLSARRNTSWCDGCRSGLCTVMLRKKS